MLSQTQALIIGGGPSGLALAYGLQADSIVLEKEERVGGLCRSIVHDGGVFDIGGHSFHTPHPEVYELVQSLLDGGLYMQERDARVFTNDMLISYPFQKFYDRIPNADVVRECEEGLRNAQGNPEDSANFEEYIVRKFGDGISRHFMLPYNRKLWARDLKAVSCEWTSERIAGAKGDQEKFDTSAGVRKPLQPGTHVGYPQQGGFEKIYESFVPHLPRVDCQTEVVHIDPLKHLATTADGRQYGYEFLASTMPIPQLLRTIEGTPQAIIDLGDQLQYMSVYVALLLVGRNLDTPIQRIYVADPEIPPHKIALNHNSSEHLRQQPHHAIMAEVSYSPTKPLKQAEIVPKTTDFLVQCGVLESPADVIWSGHVDAHFAYPVYTHTRPELMNQIKQWLHGYDIHTLGRFGDWEYINSDRCVMKGLSLAKSLREQYSILES